MNQRINLNRTDDVCGSEHLNTTREHSVVGILELRGHVSWKSLPSWDVTQLLQDDRGRWTRKRQLGELWEDHENDMWWAQVRGGYRSDAHPFITRAAAVDWLDRTAPAWKARKR